MLALGGLLAAGALASRARRDDNDGDHERSDWLPSYEPEVQRSLPVEKPADELYRMLQDSKVWQLILKDFANVETLEGGRLRLDSPKFRHSWEMRKADERTDEFIHWKAEDEPAPLSEAWIGLRPAPADRGTIVTLRMRIDPPGGLLGQAAARFMNNVIPREIASRTLHYFKSYALTGEIPTIDRQPAARRESH